MLSATESQNQDVQFAKDGLKPFLEHMGYSSMQMGTAMKVLTTLIRSGDKVMLKDAWIRKLIREGRTPRIGEEDRIKPMSRMAFFRADGREQDEHERKINASGKKKVYSLVHGDGRIMDIGAYEYAYAKYLHALKLEANVESAGCF